MFIRNTGRRKSERFETSFLVAAVYYYYRMPLYLFFRASSVAVWSCDCTFTSTSHVASSYDLEYFMTRTAAAVWVFSSVGHHAPCSRPEPRVKLRLQTDHVMVVICCNQITWRLLSLLCTERSNAKTANDHNLAINILIELTQRKHKTNLFGIQLHAVSPLCFWPLQLSLINIITIKSMKRAL